VNPAAIAALIAELEPEAQALIVMLIGHFKKNQSPGAPLPTPFPNAPGGSAPPMTS
jgi:hypothetical protein